MFRHGICFALIVACHAGPPATPGPDVLPGVIHGQVKNAYSGETVSGARLQVREHGGAVVSDASGLFVLPGIPPGTHRVVVQAPGFLSGARENVVVDSDGETCVIIRVFRRIQALSRSRTGWSDGSGATLQGSPSRNRTQSRG